jgi:aryl-alcohol dehydrogenase-like predicted oxidoreductase
MEHRQLGRTGVSVSELSLGAMMFGAWGNPKHDAAVPAALATTGNNPRRASADRRRAPRVGQKT